ncbi:MAG: Hydrolase, alpha/beta fold family functionally coupled to Phosphoribulokinase [uncultured Sulfurovum sp.]|uniref:Hydrolase, alpha/beta fold family functionally coupled to Phosphoribulokinase n=1 Tax=uncultured Sulfurovum sp. TaxID=269237 RepID=A0A6S6T7K8_9BACT|nr:MAG: Hydrolase, alpha/beta fold family functionally coupled to Phosphoribulokinase [uncultured Sulfurovum sp.]
MFKPSFFLKNAHIQTLYAPLLRKPVRPKVEIERFELADGDFLDAYWHKTKPKDERPIVILLHGLTGSFYSPYIQGIMSALDNKGFHAVLMSFRACSGEDNRLARSYHSGDTADVKAWINHVHKNYPNNKLYAIGYSIGGNVLLKLLGEEKNNLALEATVSVSAPMDLAVCAEVISKGFAKNYEKHLLKPLIASLKRKYNTFNMETYLTLKENEIDTIKTIEAFDEHYTAPMHGFKSAKDYYTQSSSKQFLKHISIPTLILHALDDPFMDERVLPSHHELSSKITLELSPYGGHLGFVSGSLFKPSYWLEERIPQYFLEKV